MKNLNAYLDDIIAEENGYFESCKSKISCKKDGFKKDYIKAAKRASREEEIDLHGKPVKIGGIHKSKKTYNRKDKHKKEY